MIFDLWPTGATIQLLGDLERRGKVATYRRPELACKCIVDAAINLPGPMIGVFEVLIGSVRAEEDEDGLLLFRDGSAFSTVSVATVNAPQANVTTLLKYCRQMVKTPPNYHLTKHNCAGFVSDALQCADIIKKPPVRSAKLRHFPETIDQLRMPIPFFEHFSETYGDGDNPQKLALSMPVDDPWIQWSEYVEESQDAQRTG